MNSKRNIIIGLVAIALATGLTAILSQKHKTKKRLTKISNEGYETAYDVLYPLKFNRKYRWTKEGSET